ncbi:E3 ubiquitin-protein ligase MARCHF1-like [Asterias amurensis]|uniref:E3 ubiquitin-protein ligase MARCHF1-like n=1 Tax=Asterias amurensis TaxID=7602 RepID=UPI003AB4D1B7
MASEEDAGCYKNEGYTDNEPGCSSAPDTPGDSSSPTVVVVVDETSPPDRRPSSPTFSCRTQMSVLSFDGPICRICQDNKAKEKLVSPCGCSGSSKYVHKKCLLKWIMLKGAQECEICQKPYDKRVTKESYFTPSEENTVASSIVVLLLLLGVTAVGIYLLVDNLTYFHGSVGISIWVPISLLCVGMIGLSVFLPWIALFCMRTSRRHTGSPSLTRLQTPIELHI